MFDALMIARQRARNVVGHDVWEKLSERARANGIKEELRLLAAECGAERPALRLVFSRTSQYTSRTKQTRQG
jgi:hypothetical protein